MTVLSDLVSGPLSQRKNYLDKEFGACGVKIKQNK